MQFSATRRFRNGVSFGGNYTLSLSDNGHHGRAAPAAAQRRRLVLHPRGSGDLQRADEEPGAAAAHRQGQLRLGSAGHGRPTRTPGADCRGASSTTGSCPASSPAAPAPGTTSPYQYQNNGANVNLTGSPDYAARVVINGDTGQRLQRRPVQPVQHRRVLGSAARQPRPGVRPQLHGRLSPTRRPIWRSRATSSWAAARTAQFRVEMYNAFNVGRLQRAADAAAARQPDQPDDSQLAVPGRRHRRSEPLEDDERGIRRGHGCAGAAHDPGADAVLVLGRSRQLQAPGESRFELVPLTRVEGVWRLVDAPISRARSFPWRAETSPKSGARPATIGANLDLGVYFLPLTQINKGTPAELVGGV